VLKAKASGRFAEISPDGSRVQPAASQGFPGASKGFGREMGWLKLATVQREHGLVQPLEQARGSFRGWRSSCRRGAVRAELDLCGATVLGRVLGCPAWGKEDHGCAKATQI